MVDGNTKNSSVENLKSNGKQLRKAVLFSSSAKELQNFKKIHPRLAHICCINCFCNKRKVEPADDTNVDVIHFKGTPIIPIIAAPEA